MRRAAQRIVFITAALCGPVARAAFSLEWDAPPSCPRPAQLAAEGDGRAEVLIREKSAAWIVTVLFFEPTAGLRRVEAASCEEASRTAVLLLQLGARNAPPPPPLPPPPSVEALAPLPAAAPAPAWHFSAGAGGALDFGSLAGAEPRVVLTASTSRGFIRAALDARFGAPAALPANVSVQRLVEVQLAGCAHAELGRFSGGPCVALAGGSWRASTSTASGETFVLSSSAQLRGALTLLAGLELGAVAGLRVNLRRPAPFTEAGTVFTTPLLASELQLTLGWRW